MKILIVNSSDIQGGAARASYRLHKSLLAQGVDSQMLVQNKISGDFTVIGPETKFQKLIGRLRPVINKMPVKLYKKRTEILFSPSFFGSGYIVDKINEINPDIVHLHWVCGGMIKVEHIARIKSPIVWSLHDMWVFTGGCHYNKNCSLYESSCGNCKVLGSDKENDLSRSIFNRKRRIFSLMDNMTIVGVSRWLVNISKSSTLLKNKEHINIPNPLDTDVFKPIDKNISREIWRFSKHKKLVLFGAIGAESDSRKGFKELVESMNHLKSQDIELIVFGGSEPKESHDLRFKTHYLGHLYDDVSLVALYNAVDVMVVPSLQEAFGQTAAESMSCGVPVVAFNTTGLKDIVDHKKNGYLAESFKIDDLACGIDWVLNNPNYNNLSKEARRKALRDFDSRVVSEKFVDLYNAILDR